MGRGGQFFLGQTFRFSFDLFHGDTSFRPVDWRIRVTPAVNLNYFKVRELGVVNPDVRQGTIDYLAMLSPDTSGLVLDLGRSLNDPSSAVRLSTSRSSL